MGVTERTERERRGRKGNEEYVYLSKRNKKEHLLANICFFIFKVFLILRFGTRRQEERCKTKPHRLVSTGGGLNELYF